MQGSRPIACSLMLGTFISIVDLPQVISYAGLLHRKASHCPVAAVTVVLPVETLLLLLLALQGR